MPCRDEYADREMELKEAKKAAMIEASLCGILRVLDVPYDKEKILELVDWKEAGVTRKEFETWWMGHRRKDQLRKMAEEEAKRKEDVKAKALAKLTPEERELLGVK